MILAETTETLQEQKADILFKEGQIEKFAREKDELTSELTRTSKKNDHLDVHRNKIIQSKSNKMDISTYIDDKSKEKDLSYDIKNIERKIEIQSINFEKAKKFLSRHSNIPTKNEGNT